LRAACQHKTKQSDDSFTRRYNLTMLAHAERADNARAAIEREKQIKGWSRSKKFALIEAANPEWRDLSNDSRSEQQRDSSLRSE
jgi:putative endonuclease